MSGKNPREVKWGKDTRLVPDWENLPNKKTVNLDKMEKTKLFLQFPVHKNKLIPRSIYSCKCLYNNLPFAFLSLVNEMQRSFFTKFFTKEINFQLFKQKPNVEEILSLKLTVNINKKTKKLFLFLTIEFSSINMLLKT